MKSPASFPAASANEQADAELRRGLTVASYAPLVGLAVIALGLGVLLAWLSGQAGRTERLGAYAERVQLLQEVAVNLETALRGYQHTGEEQFLEPWKEGEPQLERELQALLDASVEPDHLETASRLGRHVLEWLDWAELAMEQRRQGQRTTTEQELTAKKLMDGVRADSRELQRITRGLEQRAHQTRDKAERALLGGSILGASLLALLSAKWLGALKKHHSRRLALANEQVEELQVLLGSIGDAVLVANAEAEVVYLNPVAERLLGYTSEEADGLLVAEVFTIFKEGTKVPAANPVLQVLQEGKAVTLSNHTVLKNRYGKEIPIEDSAAPVRDATGELRGVILVFHDESERRERAKRLEDRERRYRSVFNQQFQFMALLSREGRVLEMNELPMKVGGVTPEQVVGKLFWETVWFAGLPEMQAGWPGRLEEAAHTNGPVLSVDEYLTAAGEVRSADCAVTAVRDVDGATEFFIVQASDNTDRLRHEEELRRSEQRTSAILATAMDAVVQMNPRGEIVGWNPAAERIFGWDRTEVLGLPLGETIIPPALREAHATGMQRLLMTGQKRVLGQRLELPALRKDGTVFPVELNITELPGEEPLFVAFIRDITTRKQTEATLRASEQKHRFYANFAQAIREVESPREAMYTAARLLGEHLHVSRCAYADVEADSEHFRILDDYTDGCASSVGDYVLSAFGPQAAQSMQEGRLLVLDHVSEQLPADAGSAAFLGIGIEAIICAPLVKEGRLRAMMAVHQTAPRHWTAEEIELVSEITERCWVNLERMRAEEETRKSTERFADLAENISQLAWMAEPDGTVTWFNRRWLDFTGESPAAAQKRGWLPRVHPDQAEAVRAKFAAQLAAGEAWEDTVPLRGAEGNYRWFLSSARPIRNEAGTLVRWFGTHTDVTHQRELAEELRGHKEQAETASRAKDVFLATLSHELRTPLTPVLMSVSALREDGRLPAEVMEQLGTMQKNIELEARLIDDLLDLTRIARGRLPLRVQYCDTHSLIVSAVEFVRDEAQAKSLRLNLDLAAKHTGLKADPARLQQVFWNLLRNAVKFTPQGGSMTIRTRDEAEQSLRIEVTDTGRGIDEPLIKEIFQPFAQGGLENDHRYGGLGLGLAIARAIVDLHGGTIHAESAGPDRGATFVVRLGAVGEPPLGVEPVAAEQEERTTEKPVKALRLLLVEDNAPTLQVLSRLLSRAGHQITTAADVRSALAAAEQGEFDGVVSDLGLPDGTGLELMEQLQRKHGLRGIALSGYGMEEDMRRSREAGFLTHLVKPVDFSQLRHALKLFGQE